MDLEDSAENGTAKASPAALGATVPETGTMSPREFIEIIKAGRRTLVYAVLTTLILNIVYLFVAPTKFEAFVKVAPVQERSNVSQSSEGLLSTIGLSLGEADFSSFDHFVETLTSVKLAHRLERDRQLSRRIFSYDEEAKEFNRPSGPIALLSQSLNWIFGQPAWTAPQSFDLAWYFETHFSFEQDKETGVLKISYQNKDRAFAEELLSLCISEADEILREEEKVLNLARHAYLEDRLGKEIRQTSRMLVADLLLDAEQRLMLANVDPSFGARIVDGPTSSSRPASPRVMLSLFASLIIGFMIGMAILVGKVLLRDDVP